MKCKRYESQRRMSLILLIGSMFFPPFSYGQQTRFEYLGMHPSGVSLYYELGDKRAVFYGPRLVLRDPGEPPVSCRKIEFGSEVKYEFNLKLKAPSENSLHEWLRIAHKGYKNAKLKPLPARGFLLEVLKEGQWVVPNVPYKRTITAPYFGSYTVQVTLPDEDAMSFENGGELPVRLDVRYLADEALAERTREVELRRAGNILRGLLIRAGLQLSSIKIGKAHIYLQEALKQVLYTEEIRAISDLPDQTKSELDSLANKLMLVVFQKTDKEGYVSLDPTAVANLPARESHSFAYYERGQHTVQIRMSIPFLDSISNYLVGGGSSVKVRPHKKPIAGGNALFRSKTTGLLRRPLPTPGEPYGYGAIEVDGVAVGEESREPAMRFFVTTATVSQGLVIHNGFPENTLIQITRLPDMSLHKRGVHSLPVSVSSGDTIEINFLELRRHPAINLPEVSRIRELDERSSDTELLREEYRWIARFPHPRDHEFPIRYALSERPPVWSECLPFETSRETLTVKHSLTTFHLCHSSQASIEKIGNLHAALQEISGETPNPSRNLKKAINQLARFLQKRDDPSNILVKVTVRKKIDFN